MKDETLTTQAGRHVDTRIDIVNPPVIHASTVLFPTVEALAKPEQPYVYGRRATPTTRALEEALSALELGERTVLLPSGLAAITCTFLALVAQGDHVLITDSCYAPTRQFAQEMLTKLGVSVSFYDPLIGAGIERLLQDNTRLVFCESPGSSTFEVQDLPAIAQAAHKAGAFVVADNTWASPLFCKPLTLGADVSLQSLTKHVGGHSDLLLGSITAKGEAAARIAKGHGLLGHCAAPDDVYLTLRGLRSLAVRMKRHEASGLAIARWLTQRAEVARVLHPALPGSPGHEFWVRDFSGAAGTFAIALQESSQTALSAFVNHLKLFGIGYSFGGYESLILPADPAAVRSATPWQSGLLLRLHIGLEDVGDLIADLEAGFKRMRKA